MGNNLSQYARDRIYLCKANKGVDLNLSSCDIKRLPKRIMKFKKTLKKLNVGKNSIQEFYWQIEKFTLLDTLIAESNELKEVCPNLSKLEQLTYLDVSNNMLTVVPNNLKTVIHLNISYNSIQTFGNGGLVLPDLQELNYGFNKVSILPTEILELRNLKKLDISGNRLNYLPDEISNLAGTLELLNISSNVFTSFPPPIATLSNLKTLILANNNLGTLNSSFTTLLQLEVLDCSGCGLSSFDFDLSQLKRLTELHLMKNNIPEFTKQTAISLGEIRETLRVLDISGGVFTVIPKQVGWLRNLRRLNITQNQITRIPGELSLLNPSIDILIVPNPLDYPFSEWVKEGSPILLNNIKPYMKAYGPNCTVSNLESTLKANAPNQFTINAFDFAGNKRVSGGDEFEVRMLLDGSEKMDPEGGASNTRVRISAFLKSVDCIVKDNKSASPGTYTVFFNSPQTGSYSVSITNDGLPIKGSPFLLELV
eukprot:gene6786-8420_t